MKIKAMNLFKQKEAINIVYASAFNQPDVRNFAFTYFAFIEKSYTKLLKDDVKPVFFLSREGKFLKTLFDLYHDRNRYCNNQKIESSYLLVSRLLLILRL